MRFLHLADLHLGKSIHGVSLLENGDQPCWVDRFLDLAAEVKPDAVLIAGDVYDRSAPSGDAVQLLSRMLTALAERKIPVLLVAGNHDSAQRLSFLGPILAQGGVHISRPLGESAELRHVTLEDAHGPVTFWLLPYVFPALIAQSLGDESLRDNDTALRALLARQPIDYTQRNVLIAHQNVTAGGAEAPRGGSETMVGGVGQVDYTVFDGFDYVALGHIHAAYAVGRDTVRYAGSPLCYHFDETRQRAKGPVLVELGAKGEPVRTETRLIPPLHPMRELRGSYAELRDEMLADPRRGEYLRLVLTDCRVTPEIAAFFRDLTESRESILMELCSDYAAFAGESAGAGGGAPEKGLAELFGDFYTERSGGIPPTDRDRELLAFAQRQTLQADARSAPTEKETEALLDYLLRQEGRR